MLRAALATVLALGVLAAPALAHDNRPPTAAFTFSPATPRGGEAIAFTAATADPDRDPVSVRWDLDADGSFETAGTTASATLTRGDHLVALRATDSHGSSVTVRRTVAVADAAPCGDFSWTPAATGDTVRLTATGVTDADGDPVAARWDLDDDGTFETAGDAAETSFRSPGTHTVALRLSDAGGAADVVRHTLTIANRAPVAAFDVALGPDGVTLTSRSSDPDGGTMQLHEAWDLDGDGAFDDATGPVVHSAFAPGDWRVALEVTDGDGGRTVATGEVVVDAPVTAPAPAAPAAAPVLPSAPFVAPSAVLLRPMAPFPVVRLRGRLTRRGVLVELLRVTQLPANARVAVACRGKGCPRSVSLRGAARAYRAGTVLEIRVTAPDAIGKLVRFTIRRGRPWLRHDGCLTPAGAPTTCA